MDHLKQSWPGLGMKCPFCSHIKCRSCLEVSVNVLACCACRGRAVRRLAELDEVYRSGKASQVQAAAVDGSTDLDVSVDHEAILRSTR